VNMPEKIYFMFRKMIVFGLKVGFQFYLNCHVLSVDVNSMFEHGIINNKKNNN